MDHAKTALITGASSGLGEAYARLHASLGGNLILVARREERLLALKAELEQDHHVTVHVLAKDLAEPNAPASLFADVERLGLPVDYLINNAGLGGQGSLAERSLEDDANLLAVDIAALTALTKLFLPRFIARGSGRILNVSSIASLVPGPWQATYFAAKAYVTSLTLALSEELRGTGVTATVVLPGGMRTGFEAAAKLEGTGLASQLPKAPTTWRVVATRRCSEAEGSSSQARHFCSASCSAWCPSPRRPLSFVSSPASTSAEAPNPQNAPRPATEPSGFRSGARCVDAVVCGRAKLSAGAWRR